MRSFEEYLRHSERLSFLRNEQWQIERNRRRTREERKMRTILLLSNCLFLLILLVMIVLACTGTAKSDEAEPDPQTQTVRVLPDLEDSNLSAIVSAAEVDKPAEEPVTWEDKFRQNGNLIEDCTLTHYCTELRPHICGTGDGLTATGVPVTAYWTCAVDPSVIPYGADVMVDYGDRVEYWKAQDCGSCVKGNHIDLAVTTHDEAYYLGVKYADVYWMVTEETNAGSEE